ncbi:hypothetical protein SAMN04488587_1883 [Methanococcoides vulcani]|uniref:Uncharacterized protein n=1 Tax=Methanococcoides vulcani TaxID=1353158 RepID=A0A1I0B0R5_9EURY|nr:hypothetical protein SAMN04488587_1883 [Methanococcoides vulcani]
MKKWKLSMAYSLLSYFLLLLMIIFIDIFWKQAFIFKEIAMIAGGFISVVLLLTILGFVVFGYRLSKDQ